MTWAALLTWLRLDRLTLADLEAGVARSDQEESLAKLLYAVRCGRG